MFAILWMMDLTTIERALQEKDEEFAILTEFFVEIDKFDEV